ncbi:MAG: PQQ-binding-like beta-propeller repeat protein [Planctomycetota bacterium]
MYNRLHALWFFLLALLLSNLAPADDWPQWRGPGRDGVWKETGIIAQFDGTQIPVKWRVKIGGGYSGPTVVDGRVYVTDLAPNPNEEKERILCFDAETGKSLWVHSYETTYTFQYPEGPRASVGVCDGRAYSLGGMARLVCLDAVTGSVVWDKDLKEVYRARIPTWGIAPAPAIEDDLIICQVGGSDGACIVALDRKTGEERWTALDDHCSYSAPIVIEHAGRRILVCWTGDGVVGLNPKTGEVYWRHPFQSPRWADATGTPVLNEGRLFVSAFLQGSLMLRLVPGKPDVEVMWHRRGRSEKETDALHSLIPTPILDGNYIYGVDSYGELRCLDARTGDRIWENLEIIPNARWGTAHLIRNGDKVWMFNETGELLITRFTPKGVEVISRAQLIQPTGKQAQRKGGVTWAHPAFANRHIYARSQSELVCARLAAD